MRVDFCVYLTCAHTDTRVYKAHAPVENPHFQTEEFKSRKDSLCDLEPASPLGVGLVRSVSLSRVRGKGRWLPVGQRRGPRPASALGQPSRPGQRRTRARPLALDTAARPLPPTAQGLEQGHCNCPRRHRATNAPPEAPPSDPRVVRGGRVGAWCLRGASAAPAPWEGGDFPVLPWDTHSPRNPPSLHSLGLPLPAALKNASCRRGHSQASTRGGAPGSVEHQGRRRGWIRSLGC